MGFVYCCLYAVCIGILSFLLGRLLPGSAFRKDCFPFRCQPWEKEGAVYNQLFHIKKWQAKVPDMSKIFPKLMQAKKVTGNFQQELPGMIRETRIAEWIHGLLCILSLPCLLLWKGPGGILFTAAYILGNIPFILIQRYNRPRLSKLYARMSSRNS